MKRNIYWTNDFMITSLGMGTEQNAAAIMKYESGIDKISGIMPTPCFAGAIDWSKIPQDPTFTRLENLLICAIENIKSKTTINISSHKVGIVFSTTKGNIDLLKGGLDSRVYLDELARRVASHCGFVTEPIVVSNACISGLSALIVASRLISEGDYDHVMVVGGDLLTEFVVSGFQSFKSVSETLCRPYDASRNGLSMGEACGAVLLSADESLAGEQPVYLAGGGISNDANHISGPSRTGDGLFYAMRQAILEAAIDSSDIAFISAHGTATVYNDEMESKAIALASLSNVLTNSLKPYFGHTLGACGVIETILSVWQLRHSIVFGTMGFETLGVPMPMNVNAHHTSITLGTACLKIASGFGGCNAALVVTTQRPKLHQEMPLATVKEICSTTLSGEGDFATRIRDEYHVLNNPNPKFFKMDDQCKLGYICVEKLLQSVEPFEDSTRTALVIANQASSLDTDLRHQQLLNAGEPTSPAIFVYTLPNIVSGEICIRHHFQGENTFLVQARTNNFARRYAELLLQCGIADRVILGWCNLLTNSYNAQFSLLERQ